MLSDSFTGMVVLPECSDNDWLIGIASAVSEVSEERI